LKGGVKERERKWVDEEAEQADNLIREMPDFFGVRA
jgi:hypothetical protein